MLEKVIVSAKDSRHHSLPIEATAHYSQCPVPSAGVLVDLVLYALMLIQEKSFLLLKKDINK